MTESCGCRVIPETDGAIIYCSKHEAAPEMYEALKACIECLHQRSQERPYQMAAKALAKAEVEQ